MWRHSGLPRHRANVVYGSRDALGRYNRRISKYSPDGKVVKGGIFSAKKTICSHDDMDYEDEYKGLGDMAVKDRVILLLLAMAYRDNADDADDEDEEKKKKEESDPT